MPLLIFLSYSTYQGLQARVHSRRHNLLLHADVPRGDDVLHAHLRRLQAYSFARLPHLTPLTDIHFAERFIDPAMGFALGWLQWYGGVVSLPTEIISATLIIVGGSLLVFDLD